MEINGGMLGGFMLERHLFGGCVTKRKASQTQLETERKVVNRHPEENQNETSTQKDAKETFGTALH